MAGRLLLDTNALVAMIGGDPPVVALVQDAEAVYVPAIVLGELYFGAFHSSRRTENIARVDAIARDRSVLSCDRTTARIYGEIKNDLRTRGRPIPENDLWIAAIASQHGLTLLTRDEHFREIPTVDQLNP